MPEERIWVAGHRGMVGSALTRRLRAQNRHVLTVERSALDLRRQRDVELWIKSNKPTAIILAAAKVGGIVANTTYPADFIYDNLAIQTNLIHCAHISEVDRMVFLGSSCIYPKLVEQPIKESSLMTGKLEPTNEFYAIAKIAGILTCQAYRKQFGRRYISVMPCNLYGPNDSYDLQNGHVLPALFRKFHDAIAGKAREVVIWGTGKPLREFLHVDDMAGGVVRCLDDYDEYEPINIGYGSEISIGAIAEMIRDVSGFEGRLVFDATKPDGIPRKLMDSSRIAALGWRPQIPLRAGIESAYRWFVQSVAAAERGSEKAARAS